MDLSLREGHDAATVSSCYCSFVHSVLFFFVLCSIYHLSLDLSEMRRDSWTSLLFYSLRRIPWWLRWMCSLFLYTVVSFSASFSLSLSDIPCGGSSKEVFANSKCENQITSHSVPPPSLSHFLSPPYLQNQYTLLLCTHTQIVVMCDVLQYKMLR